ncbi:hypothetical protein GCM10027514_13120 [Azotobacter armeniacus]
MPIQLKSIPDAVPALHEVGIVIANLGGGLFLTETDGRGRTCRQVASCLLRPEIGDTVLLAVVGAQLYLLAVIERAGEGAARLQLEGDLVLAIGQGPVTVQAAQAVELSGERLVVRARTG